MNLSEKVYRLLLRAYPRRYRDVYAQPMEQLFRDQLSDAQTMRRWSALWARTLVDWATTVVTRHWEPLIPHMCVATPTEPFRRCIWFALHEARALAEQEITLDHLLLGILREEPSLMSDAGREAVKQAVQAVRQMGHESRERDLPLSRETKRAWFFAGFLANEAGRKEMSPRDLAAGILRESNTRAARLLREHMVDAA
jgi:Asp-tRNA(Asn)/Glu-tRNA(Gln) amidotransferase A subunit family amidase